MQTVNIRQLKNNPSTALAAAREDDMVVVMNRDHPQALLIDLKQLGVPDLPAVRVALAVSLFRSGSVSAGFAARVADKPLAEMLTRIQAKAPAPYNGVGLNLYRDGNDSVAMHSDKLHILQAPYPIALISLGEPRRMLIRAKAGESRTLALDLEPGSLLCMSHASQLTHDHGIPKTKRPQGARISAVFRVRPPK